MLAEGLLEPLLQQVIAEEMKKAAWHMSIIFRRGHCWVCGAPLLRVVGASRAVPYARFCSRECLLVKLDWEEDLELRFHWLHSRWSGGPGFKEEPLEEYLRSRMDEAMRRLPHSADVLAEVLIEILESLIDGCDKRLVSVI
jgi:hypothetical protein